MFLGGIESKEVAKKWIIATLFGTGGADVNFFGYDIPGIGAIWFLLAMFWGTVCFRLLLETNAIIRMVLVISIFGVSVWSAKIVFLPFSIQPGGVALLFIYIGYLIKKAEPHIKKLNVEVKILCTIIALCCWIEAMIDYQWFLLVLADIGRGITDVFRSLCGCYIVILFSKWISKTKTVARVFSFVGEYSILFLSVHLLELTFFPRNIINEWLVKLGMGEMTSFWLLVLLRFLMMFLIVKILSKCNFIRKIFGFSMIKKEKKYE